MAHICFINLYTSTCISIDALCVTISIWTTSNTNCSQVYLIPSCSFFMTIVPTLLFLHRADSKPKTSVSPNALQLRRLLQKGMEQNIWEGGSFPSFCVQGNKKSTRKEKKTYPKWRRIRRQRTQSERPAFFRKLIMVRIIYIIANVSIRAWERRKGWGSNAKENYGRVKKPN